MADLARVGWVGRVAWAIGRSLARRAGFVAIPKLGDPVAARGNLPGERHVLWQIPIVFRRWGFTDGRADFSVFLRWQFGPMAPYQMMFAGGRAPERNAALRSTDPRVIPLVIRSEVGESVRLSTDPNIARVDAPKGKARLLDLGVFWDMASERVDFPPGTHWLTVELRVGDALVSSGSYRLEVPCKDEDNSRFRLLRAGVEQRAA